MLRNAKMTLFVCLGCLLWQGDAFGLPEGSRSTGTAKATMPSAKVNDLLREARRCLAQGKERTAITLLLRARRLEPGEQTTRHLLAKDYLRLGDRHGRAGRKERQRGFYRRALEEDPNLVEDAAFVVRYKALQTQPQLPLYKRRVFSAGLGMTLGVEGLLGIQVGALLFGMVNPQVTFSPVLQTLDLSLRVMPLRWWSWSPYVSGGFTTQLRVFGQDQLVRMPGAIFHVGVGIHYISSGGFTFSSGINFMIAPSSKDLPFAPIPTIQLAWYF